jgi:methionine transaminase
MFPSKLPNVGTTIFSVMTAKAQALGAINLAQGFPDFPCDPALIERVHYHMQAGSNQYAPMPGVPLLRQALAQLASQAYGATIDPDSEVTITSGATEAIFAAVSTLVRPGDEVIVFEPCYDCYVPAIELYGGKAVPLALHPPTYAIDWEAVERLIGPKTVAIMINSPHNPSASVLQPADLQTLEALVKKHSLYVISDEVYEYIIFDGVAHQSVLRYPALFKRSFVVGSFGKSLHVTGWKLGYCFAPTELTAEFRKVHQYLTFSTATPMQHAIGDYLMANADVVLDDLRKMYEAKRDRFRSLIQDLPLRLLPSAGSYFQLCDYSQWPGAVDMDDVAFVHYLAEEFGVAAIPVSVFYSQPNAHRVIRFCFAKQDQTLIDAALRMKVPVRKQGE